MCGLCGAFGAANHWADGLVSGATSPSAERRRRAAVANRILGCYGLKLTEWANRFTLVSSTGKSTIVDNLGSLWIEAERISGRSCDPLDPAVIAKMEVTQHGR